jgi:hypothetical protein
MKTYTICNNDFLRMSLAGAISIFVAGLIIGSSFAPGYAIAPLGLIILTIRSGVELDFTNSRYRKIKTFAGIRWGEWKSYGREHQLVLLSKKGVKTMVNAARLSELEIDGYFFELYIMDPGHTKRLYLYSTKNKDRIERMIAEITGSSALKLASYNPQTRR